jgi:hypothetical protein
MTNEFNNILQNQKTITIKKFIMQILAEKYLHYDDLLDRMAFFLITDKDLHLFGQMIGDVYEKGYMKAVADYKEQIDKMGLNVKITQKNQADN